MPLTSALYTGLSGLDVNAQNIEVIGNNIANVNTHSFKASRMNFTTQLARTMSFGTPPGGASGGTNPSQVGMGARVAGTQRNFTNGALQSTGLATDLALEGNGMFIERHGVDKFYTRAGAFDLNAASQLVSISGGVVQGYGVDQNFNIVTGAVTDITIPLGSLTTAEATRNVDVGGNVNADGPISTGGSNHTSRAFYTDAGLTVLTTGAEDLTSGAFDLYRDDGAGGSVLAIEGGSDTIITVTGVEKDGKALREMTFAFTDAATAATLGVDDFGTSLNDFAAFLRDALGLDSTSIAGQDLGGSVVINAAGQLEITSNEGTAQSLKLETPSLFATNFTSAVNDPFVMIKNNDGDGESARTSFVVYDSLGTPINIDLTTVKQEVVPDGGTIWEYIVESDDNDAFTRILGLGVLEFDAAGNFVSATNQAFSVTRANGAADPLTIQLRFDHDPKVLQSLTSTEAISTITAVHQDGFPLGTLDSMSVGETGVVVGAFTNGLNRNLGQIVVATFSNPEGLVDAGNGLFREGPNSGVPVETTPQSFGAGRVIAGSLELSNVDLSNEFVNLITASTGFSAASRVITTSDQLIQQLLTLAR